MSQKDRFWSPSETFLHSWLLMVSLRADNLNMLISGMQQNFLLGVTAKTTLKQLVSGKRIVILNCELCNATLAETIVLEMSTIGRQINLERMDH